MLVLLCSEEIKVTRIMVRQNFQVSFLEHFRIQIHTFKDNSALLDLANNKLHIKSYLSAVLYVNYRNVTKMSG